MNAIIEVFRMVEIDPKTRARIIIKLGVGVNDEHGMNITEPIVVELVKILDPENVIFTQEHYKSYLNK